MKYKPSLFFRLFYLACVYLLCAVKIISVKQFKEKFFSFLKSIKNVDEIVDAFWQKEIKNVADWYLNIKQKDDVICTASPEFLVLPCIKKINPTATLIATNMNKFSGQIVGENCKKQEKVNRILALFNGENETNENNIKNKKTNKNTPKEIKTTENVLNEIKINENKANEMQPKILFASAYSDSVSDLPMLDLAEKKFIVCGSKCYEFGKQKPTFLTKLKYLIKQLRISHYIKNLLIFFPLFFSKHLFNAQNFLTVLIATISFCLISSVVYIINDLKDAKRDRLHSQKRYRPIASYMVKPHEAVILVVLLLAGSLGLNAIIGFNYVAIAVMFGYAVLNLLYSLVLKNLPLIDVFTLSACYLLRLFYGGIIINVDISNWLYLTVLTASLFMGLTKRRNEILNEKDKTRAVNSFYSANFLDKNAYICLALTMAFYSLWAIDLTPIENRLNNFLILLSIPLVYFILMRYSMNVEKIKNSGNPVEVLLKDYLLVAFVALYVVLIAVAIYVPIKI